MARVISTDSHGMTFRFRERADVRIRAITDVLRRRALPLLWTARAGRERRDATVVKAGVWDNRQPNRSGAFEADHTAFRDGTVLGRLRPSSVYVYARPGNPSSITGQSPNSPLVRTPSRSLLDPDSEKLENFVRFRYEPWPSARVFHLASSRKSSSARVRRRWLHSSAFVRPWTRTCLSCFAPRGGSELRPSFVKPSATPFEANGPRHPPTRYFRAEGTRAFLPCFSAWMRAGELAPYLCDEVLASSPTAFGAK